MLHYTLNFLFLFWEILKDSPRPEWGVAPCWCKRSDGGLTAVIGLRTVLTRGILKVTIMEYAWQGSYFTVICSHGKF